MLAISSAEYKNNVKIEIINLKLYLHKHFPNFEISTTQNKLAKCYLIQCLKKLDMFKKPEPEESELSSEAVIQQHICNVCQSTEFTSNNYEQTCNNCGLVTSILGQNRTFKEIEQILPKKNEIIIEENDGKKIYALDKISLWLSPKIPYYPELTLIKEIIGRLQPAKVGATYNTINQIINTSISLFFKYINEYKKNSEKKIDSLPLLIIISIFEAIMIDFNQNPDFIILREIKDIYQNLTDFKKIINFSELSEFSIKFKKMLENDEVFAQLKIFNLTSQNDDKEFNLFNLIESDIIKSETGIDSNLLSYYPSIIPKLKLNLEKYSRIMNKPIETNFENISKEEQLGVLLSLCQNIDKKNLKFCENFKKEIIKKFKLNPSKITNIFKNFKPS